MNENNGSASALIESGRGGRARSGSIFDLRDKVLAGICAMPRSTIKEIAVEYFDWYRENYTNAPKRARDLLKLGYVAELENRTCRFTGKSAHVYEITAKGLEYLRLQKKMPVVSPKSAPVVKARVRPDFGAMKGGLG